MSRSGRMASPIGEIRIRCRERDGAVEEIFLGAEPVDGPADNEAVEHPIVRRVRRQLEEYFAGERQEFDLPLALEGTPFQLAVWEELRRIPFGETISYAELADRVGRPAAIRAVGGANGRNPIPILVPCHRVVASDGTLGGYSGGLDRKRRLLDLEAVAAFAIR